MKETVSKGTYEVDTPADFDEVIQAVMEQAQTITGQAAIITLTGDLGAGKTTFTQQLANYLGVNEPVVSPTFGIMKGYTLEENKYFDQLVHIDAYRIEDINETGPLRFEELFKTARTIICLEWPQKIAEILPAKKVEVLIETGDTEQRIVSVG